LQLHIPICTASPLLPPVGQNNHSCYFVIIKSPLLREMRLGTHACRILLQSLQVANFGLWHSDRSQMIPGFFMLSKIIFLKIHHSHTALHSGRWSFENVCFGTDLLCRNICKPQLGSCQNYSCFFCRSLE
jgi:hypothetical protein